MCSRNARIDAASAKGPLVLRGRSDRLMPFSVRVVLAVYRPDPDHFETQIRSLAAQTHPPERVYLVIADRSSGPLAERLAGAAGLACALVEPDIAPKTRDFSPSMSVTPSAGPPSIATTAWAAE